jgi:aspartyl-tRNA(Asn)/glutamyl-tRNA(Gln) amidotransferase subunit C
MADTFSRDDVARLARLARLALTRDEEDLFARQLSDILEYARQVQDVDTVGVPPTAHAVASTASGRDDETRPSLSRDEALAAAPESDQASGLFKVPRVIGG